MPNLQLLEDQATRAETHLNRHYSGLQLHLIWGHVASAQSVVQLPESSHAPAD